MKPISFEELKARYQGTGENIVNVPTHKRANELNRSRTADNWGPGPIAGTGWSHIGRGSPVRKGGKATVFVCLTSLLDTRKEKE